MLRDLLFRLTNSWRIEVGNRKQGTNRLVVVNTGYRSTVVHLDLKSYVGVVQAQRQATLATGEKREWILDHELNLPSNNLLNDAANVFLDVSAQEPLAVVAPGYSANRKYVWANAVRPLGPEHVIQKIELLGAETFPEGIAVHPTGEIFTGSLFDGSIQRVVDGLASYFKNPSEDGLISVTGMIVDSERNRGSPHFGACRTSKPRNGSTLGHVHGLVASGPGRLLPTHQEK